MVTLKAYDICKFVFFVEILVCLILYVFIINEIFIIQ